MLSFIILIITIIKKMKDSYRDTSIPATSRAVNLVRQHHEIPAHPGEMMPSATESKSATARVWRREARANHLRAQRRSVRFDEIPAAQLPAILEINGGSNFVVLLEKNGTFSARIQFPDAREAVVPCERIEEVYDGTCVFLNPTNSRRDGGKWSRWKNVVRSVRPAKGFVSSLFFNLCVMAGMLGLVAMRGGEFSGYGQKSFPLAVVAMAASGLCSAGLLQLRRDLLGRNRSVNWMDLAFVPVFLTLAIAIGGWAALPMLAACGLVMTYFLFSSRLGSIPSRMETNRVSVVGSAFVLGVLLSGAIVLQGLLHPSVMAGMVAMGTYATYLVAKSDSLWQSARLEAWA